MELITILNYCHHFRGLVYQRSRVSVDQKSIEVAVRVNPKMRNFPLYNEDVSLAKTFTVMETRRVDVRFEGFNVTNRTRFGTPTSSLSSSDFGLVRSQANSPRRLQFALKLVW